MTNTHTEFDTLKAQLAEQEHTIEALRTQIAQKERTIQVMGDHVSQLRKELYDIQTSKWWRTIGLYWRLVGWLRARARNVIPPQARRWLRQRLIPGRAILRHATLADRSLAVAETAVVELNDEAPGLQLPDARSIDIICFPIINWDFRFQRPQQLLTQFAQEGHRIFYLQAGMTGIHEPAVAVRALGERIFELGLPGHQDTIIYRDNLAGEALNLAFTALDNFLRRHDVTEAVLLVDYPYWEPLAAALRQRYGWKLVYDCMDYLAGFGTHGPTTLPNEDLLLHKSDLTLVSSQVLLRKASQINPTCLLLPNAGDYEHFHILPTRSASPIAHLPAPVIGYYGAIAEWFDVEAVRLAAERHPTWSFVLIGHTFGANLSGLDRRSNVHLLGERPYAQLPAYLAAFDVCTIPFLRTPLTDATNPVKVFEYLSAGKPVVAAGLPELNPLAEHVYLYRQPHEFVARLEQALTERQPELVEQRQAVARQNTWQARYRVLKPHLDALYEPVAIIVISYNGLDHTRQCINSLLANTIYPNYKVIIVDNASDEPVRDYLHDLANTEPRVEVIYNDTNVGFAAANNIGVAHAADSQFYVLLNNDTIVPPGWLNRLLWYARKPEIGLVGPVTNWTGNEAKIDVTYRITADMAAFARRYTTAHAGRYFDINVLAMFCVAFRREVWDKVGPLDERFAVGMFEDDDYARRVRAAGYRVICAEDVFIHHHGMASFGQLPEAEYQSLFERNKRLYEQKWQEAWKPHSHR